MVATDGVAAMGGYAPRPSDTSSNSLRHHGTSKEATTGADTKCHRAIEIGGYKAPKAS